MTRRATTAAPGAPRRIAVVLLVAAGLLAANPADAQNEPVRFFNRAAVSATALHVMRPGQAAWSANLLNRGSLAPGQFLSVRLGEGAGCRFDVRLVLQDGSEIVRQGADVCTTRSVDLAPDRSPARGAPASRQPTVEGVQPLPDAEPAAEP